MAVLKMRVDDVHAVLGRLLDHVRMASIPIMALSVRAENGGYALSLALETADREAVRRLARRAGGIVGVTGLHLGEGCARPSTLVGGPPSAGVQALLNRRR